MEKTHLRKPREINTGLDREMPDAKGKYPQIENVAPDVLAALKRGDHEAFNNLYLVYAGPMQKFLCHILRSEEEAKEAVQEIFMNIWMHRESIDPQRNVKSYIYTATRNKAFNILREYNVRFRYAQNKALFQDLEEYGSGYDLLQSRETQLLIEAVVMKMPPQRRLVFEMSREHGLSHESIAAELGIKTGTVVQHISAALKSIREVL